MQAAVRLLALGLRLYLPINRGAYILAGRVRDFRPTSPGTAEHTKQWINARAKTKNRKPKTENQNQKRATTHHEMVHELYRL